MPDAFLSFLPHWIPLAPLLGGVLIGLAAALMLAGVGRIAGISGITFGLLDRAHWQMSHAWRLAFLAGLLLAGAIWAHGAGPIAPVERPFQVSTLILSGLLVGWGTSLGSGCTSGHGVCGLGRRSLRSLAAVTTFMVSGALTVYVVRHGFGGAA
ncbi:YeeE/YedE family protein [Aquabacterium sp.]|uniref:YeeE/YedE family protein n=1 Tax=Aquabacterium sp. TaxID=1872578 RepID=UPI0035C741A1